MLTNCINKVAERFLVVETIVLCQRGNVGWLCVPLVHDMDSVNMSSLVPSFLVCLDRGLVIVRGKDSVLYNIKLVCDVLRAPSRNPFTS